MGKGFNNYMCKKFFHPASRDNLKRVWMAEQQAEAYKKKQEELRVQYEKEQDLHNNKVLLSKESKDKLSVNFMYEPPPGAKKEREKEDNEPEYKFEWQRKYNAPRESYCKGDSEIRDQPFGIQVRNVRCIKCHKWGHINTDKECPMYSQAISVLMANNESVPVASDAMTLVQQMREDGLDLKKSALNAQQHLQLPQNCEALLSDDDENQDISLIKSLTKKEKKKLLKKLCRMEKRNKKLKKKKKRVSKSSSDSSSSSSGSDSSSEEESKHKKSKKKRLRKDADSDDEDKSSKKHKHEKIKSKENHKQKSDKNRNGHNSDEKNRDHKIRDHRSREDRNREDRNRQDRSRDDRSRKDKTRDEKNHRNKSDRNENRKRKYSESEDERRCFKNGDKRKKQH